MRMIDADKLRKDVLYLPNCYNGYSDTYDKAMILDLVDEQPTVDAVPVVRCKNCKYCSVDRYADGNVPDYVCIEMDTIVEPDDFCSREERRDEDADE